MRILYTVSVTSKEKFILAGKPTNNWWDKWDKAARNFDLMNRGIELRYGEKKREWFSRATGLTLLVAVGTGLDLNRRTRDNIITAGFKLTHEINVYLDMVKLFKAEIS